MEVKNEEENNKNSNGNSNAFINAGDFTILTPAGSYAEQFAKEQGIPCVNE